MSDCHANTSGGAPPPLDLTPRESLSALRVVNMLHDQAKELGYGLLAQLWRAHAEELRRMCLPPNRLVDALALRRAEATPIGDAFPVTCSCGQPADGIDERGVARCASCLKGGES